ncbi:MAG: anthrone oxygenase family protein [Pseudomonadota bacterium]
MIADGLLFASLALFALMAGFFYAYSVSVMPGLNLAAPEAAVGAMRGINVAVQNPVFFVTFFMTPLIAAAAAAALFAAGRPFAAGWALAAAAVYALGAMGPTIAVNVPMNQALAAAENGEDAAALWAAYEPRWTLWNHVRTAASLGGALFVGLSLRASAAPLAP